MNILYLSPEVWPFSRFSGLAEVSHDLPLALGQLGHKVTVISIMTKSSEGLHDALTLETLEVEVQVSWRRHKAKVYSMSMGPQVDIYLLSNQDLFDRDGLYGNAYGDYEDNAERFIFFNRACLDLAQALGIKQDVVHANGWTSGMTPVYLKSLYAQSDCLAGAASLITIHNLGRQGSFWHYDMPLTGLGWEYFTPEAVEFYGKINFIKAGIVAADLVSTVSESYAKEIQTEEMGFGLQDVLAARNDRLVGISNGVDPETWNPATDTFIARRYSVNDLAGKQECRVSLRDAFMLPKTSDRPLLGLVGRLTGRKGMDLVMPTVEEILGLDVDLVVMGDGQDHYQAFFETLHKSRPDRVGCVIGYDMALAHIFMAGADMLLLPSRYEPCGLHQMHAMRYGAVPVARATGGLDDLIVDHDGQTQGTGFKFEAFEPAALLQALSKALGVHRDREQWEGIMKRGMACDFSWEKSAKQYEEAYNRARALKEAS